MAGEVHEAMMAFFQSKWIGVMGMIIAGWVLWDSKRQGRLRIGWAIANLFFYPIVLPWYFLRTKRPRAALVAFLIILAPIVFGIALPNFLMVRDRDQQRRSSELGLPVQPDEAVQGITGDLLED